MCVLIILIVEYIEIRVVAAHESVSQAMSRVCAPQMVVGRGHLLVGWKGTSSTLRPAASLRVIYSSSLVVLDSC